MNSIDHPAKFNAEIIDFMPVPSFDGLKIAVGHQARVGKDTFADYVRARASPSTQVFHIGFADSLKDLAGEITRWCAAWPRYRDLDTTVKRPRLLQMLGETLRDEVDKDIWLNIALDRIRGFLGSADGASTAVDNAAADKTVIVTDCRYPNEFEALRKAGFTLIKITRAGRIIDRDPNHSSEISLAAHDWDYTIANDGTIQEYYAAIDAVVRDIQRKRATV